MSFDTVDKLNREFERGYNNGQVKEAVATYANEGRLFANDKQIYEGLSQIEKYYNNARTSGNSKVELRTGQVIQCGSDYLVETSQYKINTDSGNYVVVWKKDGGQWKKIIDIFN
ncbi:unnamed protein product [Rotaria sordida]|nr:unnamed protein product [Rotaria sordida]CAF1322337.1 unnamed protein product [Rotaria sordida]CAF1386575.1 unnamed protein product [Rotaria sordida]CAF3857747.1 unnamed protein product [Rotaria sordida]CAF4091771.1 unnamed protein product [Rotaria sordida]